MRLIVFVAAGVLALTGLVAPALATFKGSNGRLLYQGIVGEHEQLFTVKPDGSDEIRGRREGGIRDAAALGTELGRELRRRAGPGFGLG